MRRGLQTSLKLLLSVTLVASGLALLNVNAYAAATTGDGLVDIWEISSRTKGPNLSPGTNPPVTKFFTATDADGFPWFANPTSAECTQAADPGLFPQLNDEGGVLPCGTASPNRNSDWEVAQGMILIPPGTTSLTVRSRNAKVDGSERTAYFSFWTAPGPDIGDIAERGNAVTPFRSLANIDVAVPVPAQCANPNALAYRMYIYDNGTLYGYALDWSLDGAAFAPIPPTNLSTLDGVVFEDADSNGVDDYLEADTDGDGIDDWTEMGGSLAGATIDTDGDGDPDCDDLDSDGDGNPDTSDPNRTEQFAGDDQLSFVAGQSGSIDVLDNDDLFSGPNTVVNDLGTGTADSGRYTLTSAGVFTFNSTIDDDADSPHTIDYESCNLNSTPVTCSSATITVTVTDDADPATSPDSGSTPSDLVPVTINWIDNDTIIDGAELGSFDATSVEGGAVFDNGDGTFTYTPAQGFAGTDSFTYDLCDDDTPSSCFEGTVTVDVAREPRVGLSKHAVLPLVDNGDGSFTVTYELAIENLGNDVLNDIALVDDLTAFGSQLGDVTVSSSEITNPAYDGVADKAVLTGLTLATGDVATVELAVTYVPSGSSAVSNRATVAAIGAVSTDSASDLSDSGTDPDANGNWIGNEAGENDPTVFNPLGDIAWTQAISTTKTYIDTTDAANGRFTSTFSIVVSNDGNEPVSALSVTDDLTNFAGVSAASVTSVSRGTKNDDFDGSGDKNVLNGTTGLAAGETLTAVVSVTFEPSGPATVTNSAEASATSNWTSTAVTDADSATIDLSTDLPLATDADVSKTLAGVTDAGNGSFTATYEVAVENTGNQPTRVTLIDNLAGAFPAGFTASVSSVSGGLTSNPDFNGGSDTTLANATALAVGGSGSITYTVTFTPTSENDIVNTATADLVGNVNSASASVADTASLAASAIPYAPDVSSSKQLVGVTDAGNGRFTATYEVTVENTGNEPLGVALDDELDGAFPAGYTVSVTPVSGALTANGAYDGSSDTRLNGSDVVAVGATSVLRYAVTFTPSGPGTITNVVDVAGSGEFSSGTTSSSSSETLEPSDVPLAPGFDVSKVLSGVVDAGDGSFTATYVVTATNTGNEPVSLVATDDLSSGFPAGFAVDVSGVTGDFTANAAYDGSSVTRLNGSDVLSVGGSATLTYEVTFVPSGSGGIGNTVSVTGTGTVGGVVVSESASETLEPSDVPLAPGFDVSKVLSGVVDAGDGSFTATYVVTATNTGNEPVSLVATDDLSSGFPAGFAVDVSGVTGDFTANAAYDGSSVTRLNGSDVLSVGGSATLTYEVTFVPSGSGDIGNTVSVTGTGTVGGVVVSESASETLEPSDVPLAPGFDVSKVLSGVVDAGDGSFTATYVVTATNTGNEPVSLVATDDLSSGFPAGFAVDVSGVTGDFTANAAYDGSSVTRLNGSDVLSVGGSATLTYEVTFVPSGSGGIGNTVSVTGTGTVGGVVVSESASETLEPSDVPFISSLGAAKDLLSLDDNGDGSFTAHLRFYVENLGNEPVRDIQLTDDLGSFGSPTVTMVASSGLTMNSGFNGGTDKDVLDGSDGLAVGATGTVDVDVTYVPTTGGGQLNQATVTGIGATTATSLSDASDAGSDPDGDRDRDPSGPGEDDATPVSPPLDASAGVAKQLVETAYNGDGTFTASYLITIENFGNELLRSIVVTDDLSAFPGTPTVEVIGLLDLDTSYDGLTNTSLTTGDDTLAVGASATIELDVTFVPDSLGVIGNTATVQAAGAASGVTTTDSSVSGTDPDPDGNGDPAEAGSTPLDLSTLGIAPSIGTAKTRSTVTDIGDGWFAVTYTMMLENFGSEPLSAVQLTDDLSGLPADFVVDSLSATGLSTNSAFDGLTDLEVLDGTDQLAVGSSASVKLAIHFKPMGPGSITNAVTGTATGAVSGAASSDASVDGANADPDGNGSPDESSPTVITVADIPLAPSIGVAKSLDRVVAGPDGSFDATYTFRIQNYGNETLTALSLTDDLSTFPAGWTTSVSSDDFSTSGAYNGSTVTELLAGSNELAPGESGEVTLVVSFVPTGPIGTIGNNATASGVGQVGGATVTDESASGTDPDPDGDGNPDESGTTNLSGADIPVDGGLGLTKTLSTVLDNADGSFIARFRVEVENLGNEVIENVQITDNVSSSFPAGSTASASALSGALNPSPTFNGVDDTDVLSSANSLPVGASATLQIDVRFTPTSATARTNQAAATGSGLISQAAYRDGDDDAVSLTDIPFSSEIAATKSMTGVVDDGGGYFVASYEIVATNVGNEPLVDISVDDDISATFPAGSVATVVSTSSGLTVNDSFDGTSDTALLTGDDELAVGQSESIQIEVRFRPTALTTIDNTAIVSAEGAFTGDPTEVRTEVASVVPADIPFVTSVGASKQLVLVDDNDDGSFDVTYRIVAKNYGNEALNDVRITDVLDAGFGASPVTTVEVVSGPGVASPTFNGGTDTDLLATPTRLEPGGEVVVELVVTVVPASTSDIGNSVTVSGIGEVTGAATVDLSADGSTPDPDGSGDPDESSVTTFGEGDIPLSSSIALAKSEATTVDLGGGRFSAEFVVSATNNGNDVATNVQLVDDLSSNYPADAAAQILATSGLTSNPDYDGFGDTDLLAGTDSLAVGATGTVTLLIEFDADGSMAANAVTGRSTGLLSGDPAVGSASAPQVRLPLRSSIGSAKALIGEPELGDDGTATATYRVVVENFGNQPLVGVQIDDDLTLGLGTVIDASIDATDGLTANPGFDGSTDPALLDGTDTLDIGASASVTMTARFNPSGEFMSNVAVAHARGAYWSLSTADSSVVGTNPDPNGDGEPDEEGSTSTRTPGLFVAGSVWQDENNDGIQSAGEQALPGITVVLIPLPTYVGDGGVNNSGSLATEADGLRTAVTDENGEYYFGGLPPGYYQVEVLPGDRLVGARSNAGDDDTLDSDFDTTTKKTAVLAVRDAQQPSAYIQDVAHVDVGLSPLLTVAGKQREGSGPSAWPAGGAGVESASRPETLAYTGSSTVGVLLVGIGLLFLGWIMIGVTRRRDDEPVCIY